MDAQLQAARQARKGLEKVRKELLDPTPHSVERCSVPLQAAIACMTELASHFSSPVASGSGGDGPLRAELFGMRRDLTNVNALLQNAASFYNGYARLLEAETPSMGDYSPAARMTTLRSERNFVVHG
ncbi:MAG: hypothetical protein ACR2NN_21180 [Bryobacteraceae bacterium]